MPELPKALCDAIKGYRSLYQDRVILHRDICLSNITIIPSDSQEERAGPKGVLINLDTAKELSAGRRGVGNSRAFQIYQRTSGLPPP